MPTIGALPLKRKTRIFVSSGMQDGIDEMALRGSVSQPCPCLPACMMLCQVNWLSSCNRSRSAAFLDIFEGKFRPHVLGGERRDLRSARAFALLTSRRFELTHPLIFKLRAEIVLHRFVLNLCSDSDFIKRLYPRPLLMRDIAQHPRGILAVHLVYLIQ